MLGPLVVLPALALAEDPITVNFSGTVQGRCGLSDKAVSGTYTFRDLPPIDTYEGSVAFYAMDSVSVTVGGTTVQPQAYNRIMVRNDFDSGSSLSDLYFAYVVLDLTDIDGFTFMSVSLHYDEELLKPTPNPDALTSTALPTSSADLAGFDYAPWVTLYFRNPSGSDCGASGHASVTFSTDAPPDEPPVADAGQDLAIRAGSVVALDGSGSYDDNTASAALQYDWSFANRPAGSAAVLTGATSATPSFTADVADTFTLQLIVTDSAGHQSAPDFVEVSTDNLPPTAAAGNDALVVVGHLVALDGSGSVDPENDALSFAWTLDRPGGSQATLAGATTATPSFTPDVEGVYAAHLVVSDALGAGLPDLASITAAVPNTYVEQVTIAVAETVMQLPFDAVTSAGNQQALAAYLHQAAGASSADNTALQVNSLQRALSRTDGCALRGRPDPDGNERDWVTSCAAQAEVYPPLKAALDALMP